MGPAGTFTEWYSSGTVFFKKEFSAFNTDVTRNQCAYAVHACSDYHADAPSPPPPPQQQQLQPNCGGGSSSATSGAPISSASDVTMDVLEGACEIARDVDSLVNEISTARLRCRNESLQSSSAIGWWWWSLRVVVAEPGSSPPSTFDVLHCSRVAAVASCARRIARKSWWGMKTVDFSSCLFFFRSREVQLNYRVLSALFQGMGARRRSTFVGLPVVAATTV